MSKIKICGMFREEDIKASNLAKPDYIGFIFVDWSSRFITEEKAAQLRPLLDPSITPVGVFVNAPVEQVARLLNTGVIEIAQLHGQESEEYIDELRKLAGDKPIINATGVSTQADVSRVAASSAEYILLDNGAGSTGETFDWSLIQNVDRPYFLAGGLNVENIGEAVRTVRPYAVDLCSGAETDGLKDAEKMKRLVQIVRENS